MRAPAQSPTSLPEMANAFESFFSQYFSQKIALYTQGPLVESLQGDLLEFIRRRGKRIRPLLFLSIYRILGGSKNSHDPALLQVASAIELLHLFILIHDDVIDRSELRRGLPTFHKLMEHHLGKLPDRQRLGQNMAIVVGDMIFSFAISTLLQSDFPSSIRQQATQQLLHYMTETGCGELHDILLGARDITRVQLNDIEHMYLLKTTRYTFEAPAVIAATLAEADPSKLHALIHVMQPLGLAFQIQNDLNELSHLDLLDHAIPTDLLEGKKTLLIRTCYQRLSPHEQHILQLCLNSPTISDSILLQLKTLISQSGAATELQSQQERLMEQAITTLHQSPFTITEQTSLLHLLQSMQQWIQGTDNATSSNTTS